MSHPLPWRVDQARHSSWKANIVDASGHFVMVAIDKDLAERVVQAVNGWEQIQNDAGFRQWQASRLPG